MRRAVEHHPRGRWPEQEAAGGVSLAFDDRHRRRLKLETVEGEALLLDLPEAVAMAEGDGLRCADGGWVRVTARPEPVLRIAAAARRNWWRGWPGTSAIGTRQPTSASMRS